ncbi:MAG: hypothetical protein IPL64_08825 [Flavobacteriales bacterium]|nr:hypothetical protein [Flavobacteriales bacterium]
MRSEAERWTGALLHGWVEMLTLFGLLLAALVLIGWCWNRGLRPGDRVGLVPWRLLLSAYALVLVLRNFQEDIWSAVIIAVGVAVGGPDRANGIASRSLGPRDPARHAAGFGIEPELPRTHITDRAGPVIQRKT